VRIKKHELAEAFQVLKDLNEQPLPIVCALRVAEVVRVTDEVMTDMRKREASITEDATTEHRKYLLAAMMEEEVTIDVMPLNAEHIAQLHMTPRNVSKITWLVKE
jgi:hypothetical protein